MDVEFISRAGRAGMFLGACLLSSAAFAAEGGPRYSYGEIGYGQVDFDDLDVDGDLYGIGGSVALDDQFFLFGSYGLADLDFGVDFTSADAGVGIHHALTPTMDLVGGVSFEYAKVEFGGFDEDDQGFGLSAGIRAMVTPEFELNGGLSYVDIADSDETSVGFGAVYSFTDMVAGTAGISFGDDVTSYGVGLRLYFM